MLVHLDPEWFNGGFFGSRGNNYVRPDVMLPPDTLSKAKGLEKYRIQEVIITSSDCNGMVFMGPIFWGMAFVLELLNQIVAQVLDIISRPMWLGISMEVGGSKVSFSHAYFPYEHQLLHSVIYLQIKYTARWVKITWCLLKVLKSMKTGSKDKGIVRKETEEALKPVDDRYMDCKEFCELKQLA
ncbi:unnamed protein product [Fraxinus pennsylvanica]|uniref:Uncharacterized protein n=1 Tax=Fraxinus pennsylvanica TaxID=56036 RepID=A0AAD1Z3Y6_9LAMI|nr:unnamed protein product [Fraxinus pennsylvanica]